MASITFHAQLMKKNITDISLFEITFDVFNWDRQSELQAKAPLLANPFP